MKRQIFDTQTNICYFSSILSESSEGLNVLKRIMDSNIEVRLLQGTRDIWCRDYMPIQLSENKFIGYEYTPDYLDYRGGAAYQTNPARVLDKLGIDVIQSGIILDGGNVIKTDKGIIMVEKVVRENAHLRKDILIKRLETYFDNEIILLPWDKAEKYGHADGIVRYIDKGRVLMTNYHQYSRNFANKFMKILSQHFDVEVLDYTVEKQCKYNWCYINFLRVQDKIFIPQLTWEDYTGPHYAASLPEGVKAKRNPRWYHSHIKEDEQALEKFQMIFPKCEIIPVSCPQIVEKGGALNCISWNVRYDNAGTTVSTD